MMLLAALDVVRTWAGMSCAQFASATGASCLFLGGLLLAFAASRELQAHRLAILGLQVETAALIAAANDPLSPLCKVTGTSKHIAAGRWWNTGLTWGGLLFLFASFVSTILAFFLACP
jgi:hypothetical protein